MVEVKIKNETSLLLLWIDNELVVNKKSRHTKKCHFVGGGDDEGPKQKKFKFSKKNSKNARERGSETQIEFEEKKSQMENKIDKRFSNYVEIQTGCRDLE